MKTSAALSIAVILCSGIASTPRAESAFAPTQAGTPPRVAACKLLSKEDVKKILPWEAMFDQMPIEEQPIGAAGSSCNYPSVTTQVLVYTPNFFVQARKVGKLEPVSGVGDEAYFFLNPDGYAEVYAKAGNRIVTVQATPGPKQRAEALKPAVIALTRALIGKLR